MHKAGNFFKSFLPFIFAMIIQFGVTIVLMIINVVRSISTGGSLDSILSGIVTLSTNQSFLQNVQIIYSITVIILFGLWYHKRFVKPYQGKRKKMGPVCSVQIVFGLIFLSFGMQYVCNLVATLTANVNPQWMENYTNLMNSAGFTNVSILLGLYAVLFGPIAEELIFRGLTFRFARKALPFVLANTLQALIFCLYHMNIIQGVYAFVIGLIFGWVAKTGRGIKYSMVLHILFNILGTFASGFFSATSAISFWGFSIFGIFLTILGLFVFQLDFARVKKGKRPAEPVYEASDAPDEE